LISDVGRSAWPRLRMPAIARLAAWSNAASNRRCPCSRAPGTSEPGTGPGADDPDSMPRCLRTMFGVSPVHL
jgi:hypothetical protein